MCGVISQSRARIAIGIVSLAAVVISWPAQAATTHTVQLNPGDNLQSAVNAEPEGTTFVLAAGLYRMQSVKPKANDVFKGNGSVILNGSQVLTFANDPWAPGLWIAAASVSAPFSGQCQAGFPLCGYDQDLFLDGELQTPVSSQDDLTAGSWFFDTTSNTVYLPSNPTGHLVELGMEQFAFCGNVNGVQVESITVEKYATPAQTGAVGCYKEGAGWIVDQVESRFNHGTGISLGPGGQILNSYIHNNGQMGVAIQGGTGSKVVNNEISWNNYANYERNWEAGGSKFWETSNLLVQSNYVHDNNGYGLWTDYNNVGTAYEGNTVANNLGPGILHEISYTAVISGNTVKGNHVISSSPLTLWSSQIVLANSQNVEVDFNTVEVPAAGADGIGLLNELRGVGILGVWTAANNNVHNNTITYLGTGGNSGFISYPGGPPAAGNHFDYDQYILPDAGSLHWEWMNPMDWKQLQSAGQELHGNTSN